MEPENTGTGRAREREREPLGSSRGHCRSPKSILDLSCTVGVRCGSVRLLCAFALAWSNAEPCTRLAQRPAGLMRHLISASVGLAPSNGLNTLHVCGHDDHLHGRRE